MLYDPKSFETVILPFTGDSRVSMVLGRKKSIVKFKT